MRIQISESVNPVKSYKGLQVFAAPGVHSETIEIMRKYLRPGTRVLELGAGAGAFTQRLVEGGYNVVASGIEPQAIVSRWVRCCILIPAWKGKNYSDSRSNATRACGENIPPGEGGPPSLSLVGAS